MAECEKCDGTGWMRIEAGGASAVKPCVCSTRRRAEAEKTQPGGFERIGPLSDRVIVPLKKPIDSVSENALTPMDKKIRALIENRLGKENAIRGRELALALWPDEMQDPKRYERDIRRALDHSIRRLRRFARMPIAASKENPMGYYIPATAEEARECHDRLLCEGIERIRDSQLFQRDADLVRKLEGQLQLAAQCRENSEL